MFMSHRISAHIQKLILTECEIMNDRRQNHRWHLSYHAVTFTDHPLDTSQCVARLPSFTKPMRRSERPYLLEIHCRGDIPPFPCSHFIHGTISNPMTQNNQNWNTLSLLGATYLYKTLFLVPRKYTLTKVIEILKLAYGLSLSLLSL